MDLFDTLTFAEILVETTFLGTPTLTVLRCNWTLRGLVLIPMSHIWLLVPTFFLISPQKLQGYGDLNLNLFHPKQEPFHQGIKSLHLLPYVVKLL
jgi:hypothetical protein